MKIVSLIITFCVSSIFTSGQTNHYVSPNGDNSNPGTIALPWLTIQFGLNQLDSFDTLNVLSGIFTESISIPLSNIYLRNYSSDSPVIDAAGNTLQLAIITITDKSNITIDGFEMKNNIQIDAQGILIEGAGSDITIKNCVIHDIHFSSNPNATVNENTNAQGIIVYGTNETTAITNLKIENNELYNCRLGYSEGIAVNGNVDGFMVTGNTVHDLTNIGIVVIGHEGTCPDPANDQARNGLVKNNVAHHCISPYATCGGIYIDGGKIITVENNISYHNGFGIEVGCENVGKIADFIIVRNNVLYDNEICAIALGGFDYPDGSGKVTNTTIRNNSCFQNDYSHSGNGELYISYSENSTIDNNIFYTTDDDILAYADLSQPDLFFDYNTFYCESGANNLAVDWNGIEYSGFNSYTSGSNTNTHSIFGDPQFLSANISTPDVHLTSTSPSINSGNPGFMPSLNETDMDGELRANSIVDCGADEFYPTNGVVENFVTSQFMFYPNPFSTQFSIQANSALNDANLTIYNSSGRQVHQENHLIGSSISIRCGNLSNGIYFIQIKQDHKIISSEKIVVTD